MNDKFRLLEAWLDAFFEARNHRVNSAPYKRDMAVADAIWEKLHVAEQNALMKVYRGEWTESDLKRWCKG